MATLLVEKVMVSVNKKTGWIVLRLTTGDKEQEFILLPDVAGDLLRRLKYKVI